jgi:hypothetical protein
MANNASEAQQRLCTMCEKVEIKFGGGAYDIQPDLASLKRSAEQEDACSLCRLLWAGIMAQNSKDAVAAHLQASRTTRSADADDETDATVWLDFYVNDQSRRPPEKIDRDNIVVYSRRSRTTLGPATDSLSATLRVYVSASGSLTWSFPCLN